MTRVWYSDIRAEDLHVSMILRFDLIREMVNKAHAHGFTERNVLSWIAVTMAKQLPVPFTNYTRYKHDWNLIDNLLGDYESHIYHNTRMLGIMDFFDLVFLSDYSICILIEKEKIKG